MPRPGCVWSHALLIDFSVLARVPDLSATSELYVRPSKTIHLSDYEKTMVLRVDDTEKMGDAALLNRAPVVLSLLYGSPQSGIVVLDDQSLPWESVVLGVWSQQWPSLRKRFSFSTCSLGDRRLGGVWFDLQIAPRSTERLWHRSGMPTAILEFPPVDQGTSVWVEIATSDLRRADDRSLRKFLFSYGADIDSPRQVFARLVECFSQLSQDDEQSVVRSLASIATVFPGPLDAVQLKQDRLTTLISRADTAEVNSLWTAASFLLGLQGGAAYSRVPFSFGPYIGRLWRDKRAELIALLGKLDEGERSTDFLRALAREIEPGDIPLIWREQPNAVSRLGNLCTSVSVRV